MPSRTSRPTPQARLVTGSEFVDEEISRWVNKASGRALATGPALSAFQRRMEQFPQLSPEAQLELAARVQAGLAAAEELAGTRRVSPTNQRRLREAVRQGESAMTYLAGSNFRLVMLICRELAEERYGRERALDVLGDLVGEANVALTQAMREFDPERCPVFATYVAKVVRDRVRGMLARDGAMKVANSWHRLKRIAAVRIPQLQTELGRAPTMDEIKADLLERCMEWAFDKLTPEQQKLPARERRELMVAKLRKQGMIGAIESLEEVLQASQPVASLDARVSVDGDATLGDMLPEETDDGFSALELSELRETLFAALSEFSDRERQIVLLRYGFGGEPRTYQEICEEFGVTAERIRQIEKNVLNKLATTSALASRLAAFLPSMQD
jgi:RNA polymerase primary sigma factor